MVAGWGAEPVRLTDTLSRLMFTLLQLFVLYWVFPATAAMTETAVPVGDLWPLLCLGLIKAVFLKSSSVWRPGTAGLYGDVCPLLCLNSPVFFEAASCARNRRGWVRAEGREELCTETELALPLSYITVIIQHVYITFIYLYNVWSMTWLHFGFSADRPKPLQQCWQHSQVRPSARPVLDAACPTELQVTSGCAQFRHGYVDSTLLLLCQLYAHYFTVFVSHMFSVVLWTDIRKTVEGVLADTWHVTLCSPLFVSQSAEHLAVIASRLVFTEIWTARWTSSSFLSSKLTEGIN